MRRSFIWPLGYPKSDKCILSYLLKEKLSTTCCIFLAVETASAHTAAFSYESTGDNKKQVKRKRGLLCMHFAFVNYLRWDPSKDFLLDVWHRKILHLLQHTSFFHPDAPATLPVSFGQKRCCLEQGAAVAAASACALLPKHFLGHGVCAFPFCGHCICWLCPVTGSWSLDKDSRIQSHHLLCTDY